MLRDHRFDHSGQDGDMAKKKAGKKAATKKTAKRGSKKKTGSKRAVEQYQHGEHQRANNPPVGLVTPETDPSPKRAKKEYRYDPHLDPELNFDPQAIRDEMDAVIEAGLSDSEDETGAGHSEGLAASTLAESGLEDQLRTAKAELEATKKRLSRARDSLTTLKKAQMPHLNWAGKAEKTSFEIDTVSLHVHERIDPKTIIEAVKTKNGSKAQLGLFEQPDENPRLAQAVEFYKHPHGWTNRLIAGDSLLVMNSLLEKEGMGGQVQMVYIDPPYGIKYGSNFQPFVNKRDVKDRKDSDLTREPEMLKAFRDTWELGIHSYLAYLRDRLILAKELLHESGSCFVQISDENLHHVRELLDEIFGSKNIIAIIPFKKTSGQASKLIAGICDYLVWVGKDKSHAKYRQLYWTLGDDIPDSSYNCIEFEDGSWRRLTAGERRGEAATPEGRKFRTANLTSQGVSKDGSDPYVFQDKPYSPSNGTHWKPGNSGLPALERARRLVGVGNTLAFKRYLTDFPVVAIHNMWNDTIESTFVAQKIYSVQTATKLLARCILMATDPGDIVLDPTCGSGTTAFVAEQWGRRWITTDTSRVAISLAKQRLTTTSFDYYEMAKPELGVSGGFEYETVPHVTLKSIANNPEIKEGMTQAQIDAAIAKYAPQEVLYDKPKVDKKRVRVTGPFTVEAVPSPVVAPLEEDAANEGVGDKSIARSGETLRQSEWRDELMRTGARGEGGMTMEFVRVEPLPGATYLHAEAEIKDDGEFRGKTWKRGDRVVVAFGPEHAPLEQRQVEAAWREADSLNPKPKHLIFAAFQFDPEAAKDIEEMDSGRIGMSFFRAEMNDDLHTEDLKKKRSSNESFWLIGQPDIMVSRLGREGGEDSGKFVVNVEGFDYFNMKSNTIESGGPDKIAMWMLDTDYDGRSLYPRQVFFPMAGPKDGWARLAKTLRAEIDEELIEAYRGTESLPFVPGKHMRIAVKVVDDRGFESLVIRDLEAIKS